MNQPTRCDRLIQIRAPEFLTKALDNAADKRLTSRSDYIRVALLDRLRADGIDPAQSAGAADASENGACPHWYNDISQLAPSRNGRVG
jgi:Ribbon-helix-helix protein, copG family